MQKFKVVDAQHLGTQPVSKKLKTVWWRKRTMRHAWNDTAPQYPWPQRHFPIPQIDLCGGRCVKRPSYERALTPSFSTSFRGSGTTLHATCMLQRDIRWYAPLYFCHQQRKSERRSRQSSPSRGLCQACPNTRSTASLAPSRWPRAKRSSPDNG